MKFASGDLGMSEAQIVTDWREVFEEFVSILKASLAQTFMYLL